MTKNSLDRRGRCRCGRVQFEVGVEPLLTMACHCSGCQKMTASAFSLSSLYPNVAFQVTAGEPVIGGLHGADRHYFCGYCMSWLFTRPEGMDEFVNVRVTLMEDANAYSPFIETYTSDKLSWVVTPAVHSYSKVPTSDEFSALLAEFSIREI